MASAAALIRESRRGAGLTQAELARRVKVTQPVIARLEREGANPRLETLDKVIAATGRSLELNTGPPSGLDETMIAANLKLTPLERLRAFAQAYRSVSGLGRAARAAHGS
jgi:transcriptional regulator with XRE-family HTH domain